MCPTLILCGLPFKANFFFTTEQNNTCLQEGPPRLYDVLRLASMSIPVCIILVSEYFKNVLSDFRLPKHFYTLVEHKPKRIVTETNYYILEVENDTLLKSIDIAILHFTAG
jgi:hypothetical protein